MKTVVFNKLFLKARACILTITIAATFGYGQASEGRSRNNPYSPSPKGKAASQQTLPVPTKNDGSVAFVMQKTSAMPEVAATPVEKRPSIAQATFKIAKTAEAKGLPLTEIYKIGVGDVLYVNLKNSPQGSGYFTVRPDGSIDYPLAGDNVHVLDQTTDSIEEMLAGSITLFRDAQVEVRVRQYGSHRIKVGGLAENAGEKFLQREAMPLFAIRAEAVATARATKVSIRRNGSATAEVLELNDPKTDSTLILPGDSVEFIGDNATLGVGVASSYFIGGEIVNSGQKELSSGLTLYQAIIAAGGAKGDPKKAIIRRKTEKGVFNVQEHNLRSIRSGKAMDPFLAPGDVIEIEN